MKISVLVEALEKIKEEKGDLEILIHDNEWNTNYALSVTIEGKKVIFEIASQDYLP